MVHASLPAVLLALLLPLTLAAPARADLGPCKPDAHEMLVCGQGDGAARVIPGTLSPDKAFAFAWRNPGGLPDEEPSSSDDDNEWLLIRLADGAVLARDKTGYFHTGTLRANRRTEEALWSPDSRLALRIYTTRYATEALTAFALAPDSTAARNAAPHQVDLRKPVEAAARAQLKRRGRAADRYDFSVPPEGRALSNDGTLRLPAFLFVVKQGASATFRVDLKLARTPKALAAKLISIKLTEEEE